MIEERPFLLRNIEDQILDGYFSERKVSFRSRRISPPMITHVKTAKTGQDEGGDAFQGFHEIRADQVSTDGPKRLHRLERGTA